MLFSHARHFHNESCFYSNYNQFWVFQNSFPIISKLDQINSRKRAKRISTFDFSTLYTTIPHNLLVEVLSKVIDLVFQSKKSPGRIGFSKSSVYWTPKGVDKRFFTRETLIETVRFLITNCYFTVGNLVLKQDIGIPMGIDPAPFWANLFLYFFESLRHWVRWCVPLCANRIMLCGDLSVIQLFLFMYLPPYLIVPIPYIRLGISNLFITLLVIFWKIKTLTFLYSLFEKKHVDFVWANSVFSLGFLSKLWG